MVIEQRLIKFITITNWILFSIVSIAGFLITTPNFAKGIIFGGLIVTINFHMLSITLKKAFSTPHSASHNVILAKYYVRFIVSGFIIFVLIAKQYVDPIGLFIGLSVVVASIMIATICEIKKLFLKEAI
ncbi:MAG: ATP synthase subunit I [Proteobacteria bacterium]|nr:ATP synthase subunit I [Pseudomonadota bacterium]MBU4388270.1 ATP synthase subunit I [Pseudomonadota bacterium]MCG2831616.1 ATP synthase subunit I [Desulfobacteraceae bacterium]